LGEAKEVYSQQVLDDMAAAINFENQLQEVRREAASRYKTQRAQHVIQSNLYEKLKSAFKQQLIQSRNAIRYYGPNIMIESRIIDNTRYELLSLCGENFLCRIFINGIADALTNQLRAY